MTPSLSGYMAATVLIGCLASCAGSASSRPVIRVDGSSTVYPISEAVAEEFLRVGHPEHVTVGISGTGGGFQKFCRGESDSSDASRPISPTELAGCTAAGIGFIELPVAYDGIAIVVHPRATWINDITVAELGTL